MSDGIANYDWRELRRKTLREIAEHRGQPLSKRRLLEKPKKVYRVHMSKNGHSMCGHGWMSAVPVTIDAEEVTCYYCKRILGRMK